jgi:hypothetical protein
MVIIMLELLLIWFEVKSVCTGLHMVFLLLCPFSCVVVVVVKHC